MDYPLILQDQVRGLETRTHNEALNLCHVRIHGRIHCYSAIDILQVLDISQITIGMHQCQIIPGGWFQFHFSNALIKPRPLQ